MLECSLEAFESAKDADKVIKAMSARLRRGSSNRNNKPKRSYKCERCGKYHITGKRKDNY